MVYYKLKDESDKPSNKCIPHLKLKWKLSGTITDMPDVGCVINSACSNYMKENCFLKDKIQINERR